MATIYKLYSPVESHSCDYGVDFTNGAGYTADAAVAALYLAEGYSIVTTTYFSEYDKLSKETLIAMAAEKGITYAPGAKKDVIVAAIIAKELPAIAAGAIAELAKVTDNGVKTVPFGTANTQTAVEAVMLASAQAAVGEGYTVSIAGVSYSTSTKGWVGKFTVFDDDLPANAKTDATNRSFTVVFTANSAIAELAKITDNAVKTVPNGTADTLAGVNAAMLVIANTTVAEGFTVTLLAGSTYDAGTNAWTGKFAVQNDTLAPDYLADAADRSFTVIIAEA